MAPSREIYLDNVATNPPLLEVMAAVTDAMSCSFGNPSSSHRSGEWAGKLLRESCEAVAQLIDARSDWLTFTSGATEASN